MLAKQISDEREAGKLLVKNHSENWTKDITFGFFGGFFACFFVVVVIVCLFVFLGWFSFLVLLLWTFSEDMLWLSFLRRLVLCGVLYLHCFAVFELIVIKNSKFILNIEKFTNKEKEHFQIFKKIKSPERFGRYYLRINMMTSILNYMDFATHQVKHIQYCFIMYDLVKTLLLKQI